MITRINYRFTAEEPISHFGDQATSNIRRFRRQAIALPEPVEIPSRFGTPGDRRNALVKILYTIYERIPGARRTKTIWSEFEERIQAAAMLRTRYAFINSLMEGFGCQPIPDSDFIGLLDMFSDDEFLITVRSEYKIIVAQVQAHRDHVRLNGDLAKDTLFGSINVQEEPAKSEAVLVKASELVPFIHGNAIRGMLRDLAMRDFVQLIDIEDAISLSKFHQMFSGGTLTETSAGDNAGKRKSYLKHIPMIGLFGSAIDNMTIESKMKVGQASLVCLENGTGDSSYWELLYTQFGTRLDDAKYQHGIDIKEDGSNETAQMIWYSEEVVKGAQFDHSFVIDTGNSLIESAFYRMLLLWLESPYVGGQSSRGYGRISFNWGDADLSETAKQKQGEYLDYVQANAESSRKFLRS